MPDVDSPKIRLGGPVYQDTQHVIAVHENTVLSYSNGGPNPRFLNAWTRTIERVVAESQTGLLALTIIDGCVRPPDDASRTEIRNTVMRHAAELKAFAYVVQGEGFGAAALRGALSLMSLAARYPFPMKVFGRVEEAVPWMLNRPNQDARPAAAAALVTRANSLRSELESGVQAG